MPGGQAIVWKNQAMTVICGLGDKKVLPVNLKHAMMNL
jgi:hypothetical protein